MKEVVKIMEWKNFSKRHEINYGNSWLITFSDMMTIILCFFIVFFIFSAEELTMLETIKESLSTQVEDLSEENEKLKEEQESLKSLMFGEEGMEDSDDFLIFLKENQLEDSVYISEVDRGLVIRFRDGVLFSSGQAAISQGGYDVLREISTKINSVSNSIVIEGFTDNQPIKNSNYPSNWELSTDRAIGVAKYFIEDMGINEERISVSGHGEQRPIDTNDTEEGRANNRRIEITILN